MPALPVSRLLFVLVFGFVGVTVDVLEVKADATPNLDRVTPGWATNPPASKPKAK